MAIDLDPRVLKDLLLDPKFAAEALMGWKLDDFQSARLKLDWWFPVTLDSSGTYSAKTLEMFILLNLRCMLVGEGHLAAMYFQTFAAGEKEFWPYFEATLAKSPIYRDQCRMHRRKVGEQRGEVWTWTFENGSQIQMPKPGFMNDAKTQAGRSFNTLAVDEVFQIISMGDGIEKQIMSRWRKSLPEKWKGHVNCPIRGNHLHLKGHAESRSHKGYKLYKDMRQLARDGATHWVYSFCAEDFSERFRTEYQHVTGPIFKIMKQEKASLSADDYKRQVLGLWSQDGSTFYPPGLLARGAQDMLPELGRSSNDAHYFLGFDVAPGQSPRADWCASKVLRLRPVPVKELPRLMETGKTRFFRAGDSAWEMTFVHAWMGRGLRTSELSGFIHWLDQRFNFSGICMDPGGGGQLTKLELLQRTATWGGITRAVTPICTSTEPNFHDKRPILHMFRRGGDFDQLPFIGPEFAKGDDGFLAGAHMNYRARWERGEIGYPMPLAMREKGTVETFWPGDLALAQKTIDEGIRQLGKVTQQVRPDGSALVSRAGFSLFHSPTKKDVAYAGLYAEIEAELWLWTHFGDGQQGEEQEGVYA